ncbi:Tesmin/TSO1-like CXC domain-containing protein, putative isoform 1 [Hibiscus syriacus]|uniref:Tesmin/TSO1-like CXC domain-containing protein, putative isoform 1 n=1 Tax=Hibiscus syriacus TaxID=106335 RepID=A0A6A3CAM4_HIBSY|nr:Tesmin/TSO1-like CXC domain-containing protein, putative isoform 1 [Hibiscus syriacus]
MGAATALYSATCHVLGKYSNGNLYPVNLSAVVGLSGWLPCSRTLRNRMERSIQAVRCAVSLPVLLCHGLGDDVVAYTHGERSAQVLNSVGFRDLTFRTYNRLGHYTVPEETDEVCHWLTARLGLQGSQS